MSACGQCMRALRQQQRQFARSSASARSPIAFTGLQSIPNQQRRAFSGSPSRSDDKLFWRPEPSPKQPGSNNAPNLQASLAQTLRKNARGTTEPYVAYGGTEELFKECARQCSYTIPTALEKDPADPPRTAAGEDLGVGEGWWFQAKQEHGLGLDATFNSWAQVVFLHMYVLTVRFRMFPKEHVQVWHQNLLDHFFYAAEDRMAIWHGMSSRGTRNRYLKELYSQWRGVILSYDEGLIKGDSVLATAVWRNIFKANPAVDIADIAMVTSYMRRELVKLGAMDDNVLTGGGVKFGTPQPSAERRLVEEKSPLMAKEFSADELKTPEGPQA
ncbi:hypothetical protein MBLNU230_g7916t1 [Neophaeotheca triangularis]